ncbi:MAG TPA: hypothetical protein DCL54_07570, partial [Alphaproteobacteria bacterium]|nr:hypothetical protein [Alphaproteobacteria bacterium]
AADQSQEAGDAASLATAYQQIGIVWYWRGDIAQAHRWFALAQAQALQAGDTGTAALTMLDTARLMLETGHPGYAAQMLRAGLSFGAGVLPELQVQRAQIALLQCHVRLGDHPLAEQVLAALAGQTLPPRLACLRDLERARLAAATYDLDHADSLLAQCPGKWQNPDSFEAAEHGHVRAEVALARQNWAAARGALAPVLARYAADDLAAREIDARLLMARAWDGEGDLEARTATLMAALRRALARNLSGYADAVRKALIGYGDLAQGMAGPEGRLEARFVRRGVVAQGRRGTVFRAY